MVIRLLTAFAVVLVASFMAAPVSAGEIKTWAGCNQVIATCTVELPEPMTLKQLSDFANNVVKNPLSPADIVRRNEWPIDVNRPDLDSVEIVGVKVYL